MAWIWLLYSIASMSNHWMARCSYWLSDRRRGGGGFEGDNAAGDELGAVVDCASVRGGVVAVAMVN
jgi:hypothetical protein